MTKNPSKKAVRQDQILEVLERNPAMRVIELAEDLGVSDETVRRDLAELDRSGRIKRTYGGAVRTNAFEPALAERLSLQVEARQIIGRHAVDMLGDVDSLFIGGGATTLHFARALKTIERRITVLTASLGLAMELATNPQIDVVCLPGKVEPREGLAVGPEALSFISRYRTPIAIMGASGIDEDGVSEALLDAAQVYEAMIDCAQQTFILADHSKFASRSLRRIVSWGPPISLITDRQPSAAICASMDEMGSAIVVPEGS